MLYKPIGSGPFTGPWLPSADPSLQVYKWKLPSGVGYLDSVVFSIKLVGSLETECSDFLNINLKTSAGELYS